MTDPRSKPHPLGWAFVWSNDRELERQWFTDRQPGKSQDVRAAESGRNASVDLGLSDSAEDVSTSNGTPSIGSSRTSTANSSPSPTTSSSLMASNTKEGQTPVTLLELEFEPPAQRDQTSASGDKLPNFAPLSPALPAAAKISGRPNNPDQFNATLGSDAPIKAEVSASVTVPGRVTLETVPLLRLESSSRLAGQHVLVHNASVIKRPAELAPIGYPLGNATPDQAGNFFFQPHSGGTRGEKNLFFDDELWDQYISASRFGEVNTYFHIDRVAHHVDGLLRELGYPSLPRVVVKVNAHNAVGQVQGKVDGVYGKKSGKWYPLQGGHYRMPAKRVMSVVEHHPIAATGEIHLGPGWKYAKAGGLVDRMQGPYRCAASHNAGTLYHEYGHHLTRHTADFRANNFGDQDDQCNFKTELDEAYCDYLAATMLDSPHIWAFHHRHDYSQVHRRSLISQKTNDHFQPTKTADPHANGTILASTLWDLRVRMIRQLVPEQRQQAIHDCDLMVIHSLVIIGRLKDHQTAPTIKGTRKLRRGFGVVRQALLRSCRLIFKDQYREAIREVFRCRKIRAKNRRVLSEIWSPSSLEITDREVVRESLTSIKLKSRNSKLPADDELLTGSELEAFLQQNQLGPYSLMAAGDVMVGSRARKRTESFGLDYIFNATEPLFRRAAVVLANQEGPIAAIAIKQVRNHSYKVNPKYTSVLRRAHFNLLTLANNHLLDCGREGVIETLASLANHGIDVVGAGGDQDQAHRPVIKLANGVRIGFLGYYWNRRTAATEHLPGSARDTKAQFQFDIERLKKWVDQVVVTVHWGVPYQLQPDDDVQNRARQMIRCGADVIIGHHPHIVQPIEIYDGKPIIYSVGNFAFGTGNSKAESMLVGLDFQSQQTVIDFFPVYVKNRDPRIDYQPKLFTGRAAEDAIHHLRSLSPDGTKIQSLGGFGRLILKR